MYCLFNQDMELCCDEAVLRRLGESNNREYALALISMEERRSGFMQFYSSFSRNETEERIEAIMKARKYGLAAGIAAAALVIVVTVAFATSRKNENREEGTLNEAASDIEINMYALDNDNYNKLMSEYNEYGISDIDGTLYINEQAIRYLFDGYEADDTEITGYEYYNGRGKIDVYFNRTDLRVDDTGTMLFGPIMNWGHTVENPIAIFYPDIRGGDTISDLFKRYEEYGITYKATNEGQGNVYFDGELVNTFIDENLQRTFSFTSYDKGGINVYVTYERFAYGRINRIYAEMTGVANESGEIDPLLVRAMAGEIGLDYIELDYADENLIVFHESHGLFVYLVPENRFIGAMELGERGTMSYLDAAHEIVKGKGYQYEIASNIKMELTQECVGNDPTVARSKYCVPLNDEQYSQLFSSDGARYLYLRSGSGVLHDISFVIDSSSGSEVSVDMFYELCN